MNFSPTERNARRQKVIQYVNAWCHRWYNPQGEWIDTAENPRDARETLWLCFSLLDGSARDLALADAILARLPFSLHVPSRSADEQRMPFDIFVSNHAIQLLVLHAAKMKEPVREKMESWARAALHDHPGDRQCDYQFHGFNDNMPAKASMGMILGGEYFGDAKAVEHGLWNLQQLRSLLTRRGLVSEYTSPTYLAVTLHVMSEIAMHARHVEARRLAGQCVERLWADVLGHFHPPTGLMGGPYSRAYMSDSTGQLSPLNGLLWCAFGDAVIPNPLAELTAEKIRLIHPHDERSFALGTLAWMVAGELAPPPPYLLDWINQRKYPFTLHASAERGGGDIHRYAGEVNTTHYQEEDFALGTSFGECWSLGGSETWQLQYRRRAPAEGPEDVRTCFVHYLINDNVPSQEHVFPWNGTMHVIQDGRVALGVSRPALALEGKEITTLKLTFVLPAHLGPPEKIEIADGHVFLQDGPLYLALRGLNQTDWGVRDAVRIEPVTNYVQVSFYNYEGPARTFSADELGRTLNGFATVVGLAREESFADFKKRVVAAELIDYFHFDTRVVRYRLGSTLLELAHAPKADRFRHALVNGRLLPRPIWEADGLPEEKLPFLGEPPVPLPMTIPYAHLNVIWGPDAPWMIAAKGTEPLPNKIVQGKGWAKESLG